MKKRTSVPLFVFLFLSVIIFVVSRISPVQNFQAFVQSLFSAPKTAVYQAKTNLFQSSQSKTSIQQLQNENKSLTEKVADYTKLKLDNAALNDQFANSTVQTQSLLPAHVIGFVGSYSVPTALIIDKGARDNVRKGTGVVYKKNLVGIVDTVSQSYAKVILPVSTSFSLIGRTAPGGATGVVNGEDDFILLNNVIITDTLTKGDLLLTKGNIDSSGVGVPPDIIIGTVASVIKEENNPFQSARIESNVRFGTLTMVFVVLPLK